MSVFAECGQKLAGLFFRFLQQRIGRSHRLDLLGDRDLGRRSRAGKRGRLAAQVVKVLVWLKQMESHAGQRENLIHVVIVRLNPDSIEQTEVIHIHIQNGEINRADFQLQIFKLLMVQILLAFCFQQ